MWLCNNIEPHQVRLVLTKADERRYFQNVPGIIPIKKENNKYLCHYNGKWYSTDYTGAQTDKFINFVVLKDFPLRNVTWDQVESLSYRGHPLNRDDLAVAVRKQWFTFRKLFPESLNEDDFFGRFTKISIDRRE
uniref:DDE-1 domain-containing protein n=1 Tax=Rhabditophanes sp. KR3021 TaxID=114890 RepID=A0AC35TY65_9BILA